MARYSASHQVAAAASIYHMNITGGTTIRINVYDLVIGFDATPADLAFEFNVVRTTTAGTTPTASLTEVPLDPLTVAATAAATGGTYATDPLPDPPGASDAVLLMIAMNQRATFRWVAAPGGELISSATSANGIGLAILTAGGTPNVNATMHWYE